MHYWGGGHRDTRGSSEGCSIWLILREPTCICIHSVSHEAAALCHSDYQGLTVSSLQMYVAQDLEEPSTISQMRESTQHDIDVDAVGWRCCWKVVDGYKILYPSFCSPDVSCWFWMKFWCVHAPLRMTYKNLWNDICELWYIGYINQRDFYFSSFIRSVF